MLGADRFALIPAGFGGAAEARKNGFEVADYGFEAFGFGRGDEEFLLEVEVERQGSGEEKREIAGVFLGVADVAARQLHDFGVQAHGLFDDLRGGTAGLVGE